MGVFTGGLGSQFGLAAETTYGTYVAPNRWMEYLPGETMKRTQNFLRPAGLAAGIQVARGKRTAGTSRMAGGGMSLEVPDGAFGPILNLLHGETVTPVQIEATKIYKQVHNLGTTDPSKKSVTLQLGKPNLAGEVKPFSYPGSILTSLQFDCSVDNYLTAAPTWDSQDEVTAEALGTYAPPAGISGLHWLNAVVRVNAAEQKFVRGFSLKLDKPAETNRFYLGGPLKAQPLTNAFAQYQLTLNVDYADQTLYEFFKKAEATKVEITITGRTVEAKKTEIKFLIEEARFEGDSPNVANLGVLQQQIPLMGEYDGTHPPVIITYQSEDTAL